jgi:hypothetical protein
MLCQQFFLFRLPQLQLPGVLRDLRIAAQGLRGPLVIRDLVFCAEQLAVQAQPRVLRFVHPCRQRKQFRQQPGVLAAALLPLLLGRLTFLALFLCAGLGELLFGLRYG